MQKMTLVDKKYGFLIRFHHEQTFFGKIEG
jgi:hypothetical protein